MLGDKHSSPPPPPPLIDSQETPLLHTHQKETNKIKTSPRPDSKRDKESSGSSTELDTDYTFDPDPEHTEEVPQSLPCQKRGIHYTPPGWKRVYRKKRRLNYTKSSDPDSS